MRRDLLLSIGILGLVVILGNLRRLPPAPLEAQYRRVYGQPSALPERECLPYLNTINHNDYRWHTELGGGRIDANGVVLYTHDKGYYRPLYIAHVGILALRAACEQHDPLGYAIALSHADWLLRHAVYQDGYVVWRYDFAFEGLETGWVSSMSQSIGAAFLTQMYHVTGDTRYVLTAHAALGAFAIDMHAGGVRLQLAQGIWFAQNAQAGTTPILPLNGMLLTLESLAYTGDYLPSSEALSYFSEGEKTLSILLPQYDAGNSQVWYSLQPTRPLDLTNPDHATYYNVHLIELDWLYKRTGNPIYLSYAQRWRGYGGDH